MSKVVTEGKTWSTGKVAVLASSLLYAVVFIVMIITHPGSEKFYQSFHNTYQILPPFFAGICGVMYALTGKQDTRLRRIGWGLIGAAGFSFALGQATWTYYESYLGVEVPFPGLADAGYLGAIPLLLTGVFLLFGSMHVAGRARLVLDSAIAASSAGVISWYFLVGGLWADSEVSLVGKLIGVAYPLGDIAALFGAITLFAGATTSHALRRSSVYLAAGMILLGFADSLFIYYNLTPEGYHTGSWFDWGWSFGWLLIGYASLTGLWWPQQEVLSGDEEGKNSAGTASIRTLWRSLTLPNLARVLAPYVVAALAVGFVARHDYSQPKVGSMHYLSNSVFMLGLWLIFLVILRQVLTLLENQYLTTQLRSFNANLEQMVGRRTEQLTALHGLTKAVNNTLDIQQVLTAAAEHTQHALQADAVVLHVRDDSQAEQKADDFLPVAHVRGLEAHPEAMERLRQQPVLDTVQIVSMSLPITNEATGTESTPTHVETMSHWLRAPLSWQGLTIGMISVLRWKNGFGSTDAVMLESIGVEVGAAFENARQFAVALEAADHDSVTGLLNHRAVHQRLEAEFSRAKRQQSSLSVIMMDLNNFKLFNDTYGHPVGDQVLKRVAHVLETECRKFDILARYGGDEFIALLPDTDEPLAMVVAQRLRDRMGQEGFKGSGDERTIPVTLSFGVATYPDDGNHRHELLTIADANLYAAKNSEEGIRSSSATQRSSRELRTDTSFEVLDAMVTAVDNKDRYTRRHSEDVTEYALWIAEELGLSEETMRVIRVGGLLHDVGKIGVPEDVLRKPGRLTAEEYELMKRHPQLGALMVASVPGMDAITDIVRSHHERWDGHGYPQELVGEDIPLLGRVLAVADAFSAMTTTRPYRQGMEWDIALAEIRANIGTQFDPHMAEAFLKAAAKRLANNNTQNGTASSNGSHHTTASHQVETDEAEVLQPQHSAQNGDANGAQTLEPKVAKP